MITSFEKQRYLIDFTLSCLWRRKGKNISLWTVYTGVIFLLASVMFFTSAIRKEAVLTLENAPEIIVQRLVAGRQNTIPLRWIESIAAIPGVQSVTARRWGYYYDSQNGANYTVMVNDDLKDSAGQILIGAGVSRRRTGSGQGNPIRKNDRIPFKAYDGSSLMLTVKGIFPATSELISSDLILVSEKDFIKLFSFPAGEATDLVLTVKNSREMTTIATKITRIFPDSRPILKQEILRTYEAIFNWRAGLITIILSGSFLAFMILAWDKATGLRATEIRRRTFGFMFQQLHLIRGITALENIMIPAYPDGVAFPVLKKKAMKLLDLLKLPHRASEKVEWLSGGEAQRIAIARALINDPDIIVADEPTAHLDTHLSHEFMDIMRQLKDKGKTLLIASHDPIVYESDVINRIIGMRDGRIISSGNAP